MGLSIITIKALVLSIIFTLPLVVMLVRRWRAGEILLPTTGVVYAAAMLPLAYILSMLFARDKFAALLRLDFAVDSVAMITLGVLAMLLITLAGINKTRLHNLNIRLILTWFVGLVTGIFILAVGLQAIFGTLPAWVAQINIINSWVDASILLALFVLLVLTSKKLANINTVSKGKLVMLTVLITFLMLLLTVFVNVTSVVVVLAILSSIYLGVKFYSSKDSQAGRKALLLIPGIIVVTSGLFILDTVLLDAKIVSSVQGLTKISFVDIRPNWQGTLTVAKGSIESGDTTVKLFGSGSGSFASLWRVYKPINVNVTQFWGTNFNSGIGFIPTTVITGGIVVFAAWLLFFFLLAKLLVRARSSSVAYAVAFMWLVMFFNPIDYLLLIIAFILTGLLIIDAVRMNFVKVTKFKLRGEGANKIILYGIMPMAIILTLGTLGVTLHRVMINSYLARAASAMLANDSNGAEQILLKTQKIADLDIIEQGYTKIAYTKLIQLLSEAQASKTEIDPEVLQSTLSNVLSHARAAIEKNPQDPVNYIALGNISEQLIGLQIEGAKESAKAAYAQAMALDPLNPSIPLALARLSVGDEDNKEYVTYLERALKIKPNYVPALYQYALVKLSEDKKSEAAQLLTAVIQLDNNNANAMYYLSGLYLDAGKIQEALALMTRVQQLNPDNKEVAKLVEAIKSKLTQSTEPKDNTQETPAVDSDTMVQ